MSHAQDHPVASELVNAFATAAPAQRTAEFGALVSALWQDGTLTELAEPAARVVLARLTDIVDERRGYLLVLLGLLAEAEYPALDGAVTAAVREGLDSYLELLSHSADNEPLTLALLYLLGQFPGDRTRILAVADKLDLTPQDRTRLDRSLSRLDPDVPDLGRVWPSPSAWTLDEGERQFDRAFIQQLTPAEIVTNWENDTRTVRGYAGAKAYWAVRYGAPAPVAATPPPVLAKPTGSPDASIEALRRHAAVLRCPACHGSLELRRTDARCTGCATAYPIANGVLTLAPGVRNAGSDVDGAATASLLQKLAEMPSMGISYESVLRPAFLQMAGSNWDGAVTPADEDRYITEHVQPVDGPVLDLAAGAGRWTHTLAAAVGPERVIALDMALPMLNVLRRRLPDIPAVQVSALTLPFADASLGAVNCWNALQAFPEDAGTVLREVGRCLRQGGTLTIMTFRWDADPIYRYFQASHYFPGRPEGLLLFRLEQIRQWLADAGLAIRAESARGSFVFITAERTRQGADAALQPAGSGGSGMH